MALSLREDVRNKGYCMKQNDGIDVESVVQIIKPVQPISSTLNVATTCSHKNIHTEHHAKHQNNTHG